MKEKPIDIPSDYTHLCIPCAQFIGVEEFSDTHRAHGNCIDRLTLESILSESKDALFNFALTDLLSETKEAIIFQIE